METIVIKSMKAKGKNVRIEVYLLKTDDFFHFVVKTKRLNNFKNRQISRSEVSYSIETFMVLAEIMFTKFFEDVPTKNILHKEISEITKFIAHEGLNPDYYSIKNIN